MDPNQIIGMGVDAYNSLDDESKHALTYPTAKTLGLAIDGLVSFICYPLLKARIFTQSKLKQYQNETAAKINKIPDVNRDSSKLGLVVKAIEESQYQINEDDIRKMYVNLIASTVDNRKNSIVNPRLATVVSQFGIKEAKLMKEIYLSDNRSLPTSEIWAFAKDLRYNYKLSQRYVFIHNKPTLQYHSSIDILKSLGVINATNKRILTTGNSEQNYKIMKDIIQASKDYKSMKDVLNENEYLEYMPSYITLTDFGRDLCHCIFE